MNRKKMGLLIVLLVLSLNLSCLFPDVILADNRSYYEITSGTGMLLGSEMMIEVLSNNSNYLEEWEVSEKAIEVFAQKDALLKAKNAEFLKINGNEITFSQLKNLAQISSEGESFYQGYGSIMFASGKKEGYTYATSIKETEAGLLIKCFFLDLGENNIYKLELKGRKIDVYELKNKIQIQTNSTPDFSPTPDSTPNPIPDPTPTPILDLTPNQTPDPKPNPKPNPKPDPTPTPTPTPTPDPTPEPTPVPRNPGLDDPGSIIPGATI